jgi:tight adherence protein C
LPTVAAVLALKIENNKSLVVAVSDVVAQGSGPVVDDLARAVHLVNAGYGEIPAFALIAKESAEPSAARFYRFLAAAAGGGLDLTRALLDQASELRTQRREEIERSAARRQMALVVPNLIFMAPVLFAFLLAPLPQLLFGK